MNARFDSKWLALWREHTPLEPGNYDILETDVVVWRRFLRSRLILHRGLICEECGARGAAMGGGCHIHEGIVKRNELTLSVDRWWYIFSEFNCFILCGNCHLNKALTRRAYYAKSVSMYGKRRVDAWLRSLPYRFVYTPEGN